MLSFYRNLKIMITSSPAMLARMLLVMIFAMQSVAAMADNCALEHQECGNNQSEDSRALANELPSDGTHIIDVNHEFSQAGSELCDDVIIAATHVDDDCAECSDNCCSCCMTLMSPANMMQNDLVHFDYVAFTFTSTVAESPYFSFLRPPQA